MQRLALWQILFTSICVSVHLFLKFGCLFLFKVNVVTILLFGFRIWGPHFCLFFNQVNVRTPAPNLSGYLGEVRLQGHHQTENQHFFVDLPVLPATS